MTGRDEVTELADRLQAKRGEELGIEFVIDFASLTDEERDDFLTLMEERAAHGEERLEAIEVQNRALKALLRLQVQRAPGMSLREAIGSGRIGLLEVVESIRSAEPDLMAARVDENRSR